MDRREFLRITGAASAAAALADPRAALAAEAQPPVTGDFYGPLVKWRQSSGYEVTPIHIGLLPSGDLFFVNSYNFFENPTLGGERLTVPGPNPEFMFLMEATPAHAQPPESVLIEALENPPPMRRTQNANVLEMKSLVCSGHALMADGKLFFASGPRGTVDMNLYNAGLLFQSVQVDGIADSVTYVPDTGAWIINPGTIVPGPVTGQPLRWYATVTRLADGRMLVTGGYEKVLPVLYPNSSVEVFDPVANAWTAVSDVAHTPPGIENPDYPHVFQYPDAGKPRTVLVLGGSGEAMFLKLTAQGGVWERTGNYRPNAKEYIEASAPKNVFPNHGSSTALLPLRLPEDSWGYANGSIINVGGEEQTPMQGQIDVYDPVANAWRPSIAMHGVRHDPAAVLLPDGRVLVIAGFDDINGPTAGYAEYVDPRNGFALTRGTAYMPEPRAYHTMVVLLPDGRVLLGGGNVDGEDGTERSDFRYYYPDYMFMQRPEIVQAPDTIRIGQTFSVVVPRGTRIGEAVLMGLGSMTHAFDMNQRHVQLRVVDAAPVPADGAALRVELIRHMEDAGYDVHRVQAPAFTELAPPGHYAFFILDENRVPSEGRILKLEPQAAP